MHSSTIQIHYNGHVLLLKFYWSRLVPDLSSQGGLLWIFLWTWYFKIIVNRNPVAGYLYWWTLCEMFQLCYYICLFFQTLWDLCFATSVTLSLTEIDQSLICTISRSKESKTKESDDKAIDRTVATLLFTTMKFCNSTEAATSTSGLDVDTFQSEHQANSRVYHPGSSIVKGGDAEVPTFDLMNQPSPRLNHTFFSTTPLKGS